MKTFSAVRRQMGALVGIGALLLLAGCGPTPQGNWARMLSGYGTYHQRPPVDQNALAAGIAEAELRDAVGLEPGATRTETLVRDMLGLPPPGATLRRYKYKDESGNKYKGKITAYQDGRVRHTGKRNGKKFKYESWW